MAELTEYNNLPDWNAITKGTILDPAVNGTQGGFAGGRAASRVKEASANKLLIGYKKVISTARAST